MEYCLYVNVYQRVNGNRPVWIDGYDEKFGHQCIIALRNIVFEEKRKLEHCFTAQYAGLKIQIVSIVDFITDNNQYLIIEGSNEIEQLDHRQKEYEYLKDKCLLPINFQPKTIKRGSKTYEVLSDYVPLRKSSYLGVKMKI